jgi:aspartate/methionine/tyrosine aminotransferase
VFARLARDGTQEGEREMLERLKKERVRLVPGRQYHCAEWGWFRIVFALKKGELEEGLRRIEKALRNVPKMAQGKKGSLKRKIELTEEVERKRLKC